MRHFDGTLWLATLPKSPLPQRQRQRSMSMAGLHTSPRQVLCTCDFWLDLSVSLHITLESEQRDWANLVHDAIREVSEKLVAIRATGYLRLRSVCKLPRSTTANGPT